MLTLDAHGYRVVVSPEYGATLLAASWRTPQGDVQPLLLPLADPSAGLSAGSFVMAPFVNRIAAGRFRYEGRAYQLPINRPEENMAIHGDARDRAWQVLAAGPDHVHLADQVERIGSPWRYRIAMRIRLAPQGISIQLSLRNTGTSIFPFGMGLHPWFVRDADTTLAFHARGHHSRDDAGLPYGPCLAHDTLGHGRPAPLAPLRGSDLCFVDWVPAQARIQWPSRGLALDLHGSGALRHLHVYVPAHRDGFCAEPVSHLPDAINRPDLGPAAAMQRLAPGASLRGALQLRAHALASSTPPSPDAQPAPAHKEMP